MVTCISAVWTGHCNTNWGICLSSPMKSYIKGKNIKRYVAVCMMNLLRQSADIVKEVKMKGRLSTTPIHNPSPS